MTDGGRALFPSKDFSALRIFLKEARSRKYLTHFAAFITHLDGKWLSSSVTLEVLSRIPSDMIRLFIASAAMVALERFTMPGAWCDVVQSRVMSFDKLIIGFH